MGLPGLNQYYGKQGLMCLAQGHNTVTPVRLEPAVLHSQVKHSIPLSQWAPKLTKSEDTDEMLQNVAFHQGLNFLLSSKQSSGTEMHHTLKIPTCDPLKNTMDNPILIAFICMGKSIKNKGLNQYSLLISQFSQKTFSHFFLSSESL